VDIQNLGGDNYRFQFVESPGLNLGCDQRNLQASGIDLDYHGARLTALELQKNNKMFVTRHDVEWKIDQTNQERCFRYVSELCA
jgi:hypothetical protein